MAGGVVPPETEDGAEREVGEAKQHPQILANGTEPCSRAETGVLKPFRPEYDRVHAGPLGSACRTWRIWRGQDDPNLVVIEETYASREAAEAMVNHPDLPAEIANAGVDMSSIRIDYMDEVYSGTR
jgi:hypothetical protein